MSPGPIDHDLPCSQCSYNLRTLLPTSRCPECGQPILRSIVAAAQSRAHHLPFVRKSDLHNVAYLAIASVAGLSAHALRFVHEVSAALLAERPAPTPRDFCQAIHNVALIQFHDASRASAALQVWDLTTPQQIGQIISLLVQGGLLPPGPHDSPDAFNGLFVLT